MSDLVEIKERIHDDEKIVAILEELECQNISEEQGGELITAQLPIRYDSRNERAVQVKNTESLSSNIRNKGISGDIFFIVGFILYGCEDFEQVKDKLYQIKAWICNTLGYDEYLNPNHKEIEDKPKKDWNAWLRPFQKNRKQRKRKKQNNEDKVNRVLDGSRVFNRYVDSPSWHFRQDGIMGYTQREFGVMFDNETERVIYPFHNTKGELIGIKGRYVGDNKKTMEKVKYLFLYKMDKSIELYNYHRAKHYIEEAGEVIVFESAKSCMLAWQWGYKNCVSIEGNELTPVQASLLKQLECHIVFALDKDMEKKHVEKQSKQIKSRVCYMIRDKKDYLVGKESPVDKGKTVWEDLYQNYKQKLKILVK